MNKMREIRDDFRGHRVYSPTAGSNVGHNYLIADTSSSGSPTYAPAAGGGVAVDLESTSEVQNVCLYQGDILSFDITKVREFGCTVKMNQATLDAASMFAIGLASARNDAIDSIALAAIFRLIGADQTVYLETDDGTTNNDDVDSGKTLSNSSVDLLISFATGLSDVRFFIDGQPVATSTVFDMSAATGNVQLFAQIQKTADTNTDGFTLEDWFIRYQS